MRSLRIPSSLFTAALIALSISEADGKPHRQQGSRPAALGKRSGETISRADRASPKVDFENLYLEWKLEDVGGVSPARLVIRSSSAGPGHSRMTLLGPTGRRIDQAELGAVEGVRFIERAQRRPLVEVRTEGHGTGLKYRELLWYCVDRNKLELVLSLTEALYRYVYDDPHPVKGQSSIEHESSQVRLLMPPGYYFRYPPWPVLRVRTVGELRTEDEGGKLLRVAGTRTTEAQYEFDPASRNYKATSRRVVSQSGRWPDSGR